MKKLLNLLQTAAAHVNIICAGMILTFLVIEVINPYAGFINHGYTKIVLSVWVGAALLTSIFSIAAQRREFRRRQKEAARRRQREREARRAREQ